jgi:HSP20 family molecular chaperone IbpA
MTDTQSSSNQTTSIVRSPKSALFKTQDGFELTVDLPGAPAEEIKIEMKENHLFLDAPTLYGFKYQRTYAFKSSFLWEDLKADWKLGRLQLTLPINKPKVQTIPIAIEYAQTAEEIA